ncbi:MAG: T9SS type A sorting domain-containing protein [Bacteroidetes bacterium]|nr:T9SS type A sorting domain-containing protein [Bacteroidota bacterium]
MRLLPSFLLLISFLSTVSNSTAQTTFKVLFLGNSYTGTNNLPQLIADIALSAGDTLIFDSHMIGGYQLIDHSGDSICQSKIMAGNWDYVVMQGQSQEPIVAYSQFLSGASGLYSQIKQYNPCAVTMPYMTWGRKNGDAANCPFFPEMCTYESMDSTLRIRYLALANSLQGEISPVSMVWNYLRQNHPTIELYQPDESHPSAEGSYAAACCFYASIFKKDPTLITFNFGLNANDASIIRNTAKTQVFDSLMLWDFKRMPVANIRYQMGAGVNEAIFQCITQGVRQNYLWDFGDGTTTTTPFPTHSYSADGTYTVSLTTTTCDLQGVHTAFADSTIQFCSHTPTIYNTLPWLCQYDTLWTQPATSYQWLMYGTPIPETNQYLANYAQYGPSGFSVISTVNGCAELSQEFMEMPQWSGYYFDGIGDPCVGDTVAFAVLHINGFLSGSENIFWYKNDTLLPLMTNEDTLLITSSGKYECKINLPNSNCPLDTTSTLLEYNCGVTGIDGPEPEIGWTLFPNPATSTITVHFSKPLLKEQVHLYNALGRLIKVIDAFGTTTLTISELPVGLYMARLQSNRFAALKFIRQ